MSIDQLKNDAKSQIASVEGDVTKAEAQTLGFVQKKYYWFILGAFVLGVISGLVL